MHTSPVGRLLLLCAGLLACGDADGTTADASSGAAASSGGSSSSAGTSSTGGGGVGTTSGSSEAGAPTTGASDSGGSGGTGDAVGPGCAEHVSFTAIQTTILDGCGGYIGCHLMPPIGGSLDLRAEVAYENLVGVASAIAPGELRVSPGDSANSLLYRKLIDELAADDSEGGPMPKTMTAMMWSRLPDAQIEQVRCWIDEGAPKD